MRPRYPGQHRRPKTSEKVAAHAFMNRKKRPGPPPNEGNASNAKDPAKTVDAAEAEKKAQPARDREQERR